MQRAIIDKLMQIAVKRLICAHLLNCMNLLNERITKALLKKNARPYAHESHSNAENRKKQLI